MIRTTTCCESCGTVALKGDQYFVGIDAASDACYYHFDCPRCGGANRRATSPRIVAILTSLGALGAVEPANSPMAVADFEASSDAGADDWNSERAVPA